MTTIVRKDNVIVYESRATRGTLIISEDCEKKIERDGVVFIYCGSTADIKHLIESYLSKTKPPKEADVEAFIIDKGEVYRGGTDQGEFWYHEASNPDALGSGKYHALTALDCGKNPAQAVAMAIKRDSASGGKIKTHVIKRQP